MSPVLMSFLSLQLYSSGIYCENSPQEDDLFGFSVSDVHEEVKRGKKLKCSKCKRSGATSGCEIKRCPKSYHYPCALEDEALPFDDTNKGKYALYCLKHRDSLNDNQPVNGRTPSLKKPAPPRKLCKAGELKGGCLTCENKEGKVPLDSLSSKRIMSYCDKHAPSSHKSTTGESSGAGPSVSNGDANSSSSTVSKRRLSSDDDEEVQPVRNKSKRRTTHHLFESNEVITNTGTLLFGPIEDDEDFESADSPTDSALLRNDTESPTGSGSNQGSGNQPEDESKGGDRDDDDDDGDTIIDSDAESQSLLAPVEVCVNSLTPTPSFTELSPLTESAPEKAEERKEKESSPEQNPAHSPDGQTAAPSVPLPGSTPPSPHASKPSSVTGSPPHLSSASSAPPEPISTALLSFAPSPEAPPPDQDPDPEPETIDSARFWKNCNAAGCTRAMFSDFMKEMNEISERIQSEQASQTDYDRALTVMASSGQLEKLVEKQQKELQRKQRELEKAAAAMSEVVSALQS